MAARNRARRNTPVGQPEGARLGRGYLQTLCIVLFVTPVRHDTLRNASCVIYPSVPNVSIIQLTDVAIDAGCDI